MPPRPSQPSATAPQPVPSSHSVATRSQHPPPIGPCSDSKRLRIPSQGSAPLGSHPGYRPQFPDNTRPVGFSTSSSARSSRGPYAKGKDATTGMICTIQSKGADKGTFKGTDSFLPTGHLWPLDPLKALPNIHQGSLPQVLLRVLLKTNPMVIYRVRTSPRPPRRLQTFSFRHYNRLLSDTLIYLSRFYALLPPVLAFICVLSSLLWALVASLGILSGSSLYFFFSFSFLFLPTSSSLLCLPCLLSLPPFSLFFPFFFISLKVLAQSGFAQSGSTLLSL